MSIYTYQKEAGLMNPEKPIQAREEMKTVRFPIPEQRLPERHDALYTGAVNGVPRELCLLEQTLPGHIVPLREYRSVAGFSFTVKSAPQRENHGDIPFRTEMLTHFYENAFAVWHTGKDEKVTLRNGVITSHQSRFLIQERSAGLPETAIAIDAPTSPMSRWSAAAATCGSHAPVQPQSAELGVAAMRWTPRCVLRPSITPVKRQEVPTISTPAISGSISASADLLDRL